MIFRKIMLMFCFLVYTAFNLQSQTVIAVLPLDAINVDKFLVEQATLQLQTYLIGCKRYVVVDRQIIDKILKEQALQQSGAVDLTKVVETGKILGADKIITGKLYRYTSGLLSGNLSLAFSVIDVASSRIEFSKDETDPSGASWTARDLAFYATADFVENYPLIGRITNISGNNILINLGENYGVASKSRLFVAHKENENDQNYLRKGMLKVIDSKDKESVANLVSLTDNNIPLAVNDFVSPEPLPYTRPRISDVQLLPNVKKGNCILKDDMRKQYLRPVSSSTPLKDFNNIYKHGSLNLDARKIDKPGSVSCFYPRPYNQLNDFVMEGEFQFMERVQPPLNHFNIWIRYNNDPVFIGGYFLLINNGGYYTVRLSRQGKFQDMRPMQPTSLLKEGKNTFKFVVCGSKFDCYLNGEFLVGCDDELFADGAPGFFVENGGFVAVKNIVFSEINKK